ncbi:MAG: BrnT family toxin [Oscillatoria sp. PMC 1068.18]|nr:BrnT family toxin [Oscillatoria sp. PMC 1076.18]MEC4987350.1 BrnT family toxin [Oscillatoria sp. PMC 1068.18]
MSIKYHFDWNPVKDQQNRRKHNLSFQQAATVFRDPFQLSIYDEHHSEDEERWITIGLDNREVLRVVVHTFEMFDESFCEIRIVSARKATTEEAQVYYQRRL